MKEKYLPIGTVCSLKGKSKKVMITGFYCSNFSNGLKMNDYSGCAYPEGLMLPELTCSFDHSDIEKVDFMGFENDEELQFKSALNGFTNEREVSTAQEFHEKNDMILTSSEAYSKLLFDEDGVVMIAEPATKATSVQSPEYKFDESGVVVAVNDFSNTENPFKNQETTQEPVSNNNVEILAEQPAENLENKKDDFISKIKFDENGVVVADNTQPEKEKKVNYRFDENGVLIAIEE